MRAMSRTFFTRPGRLMAGALSVLALGACSVLSPTATPPPAFYSLDNAALMAPARSNPAAPTLIINPPRAAAGFDSQRIIYMRENHKLEYFANSEWVDPPARMLGPLLVAAIEQTGAFSAVVLTPGAAGGDLRLDTEIVRLRQEFQTSPSRVRFALRAYLIDDKTRRVLAWRQFDAAVDAASDDPYGGVLAANDAVQTVLQQLSAFCVETVASAH